MDLPVLIPDEHETKTISVAKRAVELNSSLRGKYRQIDSTQKAQLKNHFQAILLAFENINNGADYEQIKMLSEKGKDVIIFAKVDHIEEVICESCHQTIKNDFPLLQIMTENNRLTNILSLDFHLFGEHDLVSDGLLKLSNLRIKKQVTIQFWEPTTQSFTLPEQPLKAREFSDCYFNLLRDKELRVYKGAEAEKDTLPELFLIHGAIFSSSNLKYLPEQDFRLVSRKMHVDSPIAQFLSEFNSPKL